MCSFANTDGGDIIYGISDECKEGKPTGLPGKIVGLKANESSNTDRKKTQLQDIINRGISPQVTFQIQVVRCPEGEVLIIRVEKSWNPPHIVQERSGFFHRNGSQCQEMDYQMIKNSFLLNNSYTEQIRKFQKERILLIKSGQTPIRLEKGPKIVLHLFPLASFHAYQLINLKKIEENETEKLLNPLETFGQWDKRYNADGFVTYQTPPEKNEEKTDCYSQIFRNGVIEYLNVLVSIGPSIKETIKHKLNSYLKLQNKLDVHGPFIIIVSLLDIRGKRVVKGSEHIYSFKPIPIDRDPLLLPDIVLENSFDLDNQLRPMFDALWQASGWPDSE